MIHYISIWGENRLNRKLAYSPAGLKKAKYIVNVLSRFEEVKVASFASGGSKWNGFYHRTIYKDSSGVPIEFFYTFGSSSKYLRLIERGLNILQMCLYLITIPKDDIVIFYHERYFRHAIKFLRFFKSTPKIIYQIEEVYTYAGNHPQKMIKTEINSFKQADAYILVNDILSSILKLDSKKPSCVAYGPYIRQKTIELFAEEDNNIHVVYAGILDKIKRGAEMAINSCEFLPEKYCVHIAGFGKPEDVEYIKMLIEDIKHKSKCKIIYEGCLNGQEYDKLMNRCSIGLSTQVSGELNYADTSFPSKVINYLSYGLTVVSTKIKVLQRSQVSDLLSFYEDDNPKSVAEAIIQCPIVNRQKAAIKIDELDINFELAIKGIIKCLRK